MAEFMKDQSLEVDSRGNVELINHLNDDAVVKENYEERKENTNNGMTDGKTMRHVAQIPSFLFYYEPLLKEYHATLNNNPEYARKCLRTWLTLHPEYKVNTGRI